MKEEREKKGKLNRQNLKPCFHQAKRFSTDRYGTQFFVFPLSKVVNGNLEEQAVL